MTRRADAIGVALPPIVRRERAMRITADRLFAPLAVLPTGAVMLTISAFPCCFPST